MPGVIPTDSYIHRRLHDAVAHRRCVVIAGLPGIGKSLLTLHASIIAREMERPVSLLQWDAARTPFQAEPFGSRYPERGGVADPMVRLASDIWVRDAVAQFDRMRPREALLLVEAPLIGGRLLSLVRPKTDDAEGLLVSKESLFLLPVPSREIKEALRKKRSVGHASNPGQQDASVDVLDILAEEINLAGQSLDLVASTQSGYDPETYAAVYLHTMRHRNCERLDIDQVFPVADGALAGHDEPVLLGASPAEAEVAFLKAEQMPLALRTATLVEWYH